MIELSDSQKETVEKILDWKRTPNCKRLVLGGFAGTGKTTLIRWLLEKHKEELVGKAGLIKVAAFTGKAAQVLIKKGVSARTIHKTIYMPIKEGGKIRFVRAPRIDADLLIVDEASMVNYELYNDLSSYNVPLLFVGDMGQLEPIGDNPNLMANPDVQLTEIHRQAMESDIVRLSLWVREGHEPKYFKPTPGKNEVFIVPRGVAKEGVLAADQALCGFNKTRAQLNTLCREHAGRKEVLEVGDRLICLRNNYHAGVFNGSMGVVTKCVVYDDDFYIADIESDEGIKLKDLMFPKSTLTTGVIKEHFDSELTYWTYGYCITTHKAQGSEYKKVAVVEELHPEWDADKWRYTAITRAAEKLLYAV